MKLIKNKGYVLLVLIMLGSLVFAGCAAPAPEAPAPEKPEVWEWPSTISITCDAPGGAQHTGMIAWTPVFEADTGVKARITPESGEVVRRQWLRDGEFDFSQQMQATYGAHWFMPDLLDATAEGVYFPMRVAWVMPVSPLGFMVRGDSGLKTPYDIKPGTKIAMFTLAPATVAVIDALLAWAQLDKEDVQIIPFASWSANQLSILEGKADVAFAHPTAPDVMRAAAGPHGVAWLELDPEKDPEGAKRFLAVRNSWPFGAMKQGVKSAIGVKSMLSPSFLFSTEDTDPELVYHLAKWLHENFDAYKGRNINCERMSLDLFRASLNFIYIPVHQGTIKYLREIGVWTADDDALQEYNLDLLRRHIEAYDDAIAEAVSKDVGVSPDNPEWIDIVKRHIEELPGFGVRL